MVFRERLRGPVKARNEAKLTTVQVGMLEEVANTKISPWWLHLEQFV